MHLGKEILYCHQCGKKLYSEDFTRGRAHTFDHRQFCTSCLPQGQERPAPSDKAERSATRRRTAPALERASAPAPRAAKFPLALVVGGIGAAVAVVLIATFYPSSPPAKPSAPADPVKAVKTVETPREPVEPPPKPPEPGAKYQAELDELDRIIRQGVEAERFGGTIDVVSEAVKRHPEPEWKEALTKRTTDVREGGWKTYADLKRQAQTARSLGDAPTLAKLRARIVKWELHAVLAAFDKDFGASAPR